MKIKTQDYNNVIVMELQGELDSEAVASFQDKVMDVVSQHKPGLVIDMANVTFIDSEGLESLLWARDYCSDNNCQVKLAVLDENCRKIFEITRLENEFDRYEELSEAVKSFV